MQLKDLPELNFLDADVDSMLDEALVIVKGILKREISRSDPLMIFVKSLLAVLVQMRLAVDELCRQNLLAYARADNLSHIGILTGVSRLPAQAATCTVEVRLSAPRERATIIKSGTRINAGDNVNFSLDEAVVFASGETSATVKATCQEVGTIGNGYKVGEISKVVDPQAWLLSIENITESAGGSDEESDDDYRLRIAEAPEKFSNAGSRGAYEFHAKSASNLISDVYVESENPGEVSVYVLLNEGEIPNAEMLEKVAATLNDTSVRPLTDLVHVLPPEIVTYDVEVRFWIARSSAINAVTIETKCEAAVEEYILWQKTKLGRDINSTELIFLLKAAGAKRVEVVSPTFEEVANNAVAIARNVKVTYCGLEDD